MMLGGVFASLGMKIASGTAVVAFAFAGVQTWRLSSAQAQRDALRSELAGEQARHAVTRQSVGFLTTQIDKIMADAKAREAEFNAAKTAAQREHDRLAAKAKTSDAKIARLLAIPPGTCPASADLLRELEGL